MDNNLLIEGDNLKAMLALLHDYKNKVNLIITDPPYNTNKKFRYNDKWGKDHTQWIDFMIPRLILMKEILTDNGVICVCIGDEELANLLLLMNKVFDEKNKLNIINWQKAYSPKGNVKHVSSATEYILVYSKNINNVTTNLLHRTESQLNRVTFEKQDKEEYKYNITPSVSWGYKISGHSQEGSKNVKDRIGINNFVGIKPVKLFLKLVHLWSDKNSLILDPFAGTGTTGEAVLLKNKEDGGNRRFILIEQGNTDNNDSYCRTVTKKRLDNVISGKWADGKEHEGLGGSYEFHSMYESKTNQKETSKILQHK